MGLFDSLKKITDDVGKSINESGIKDELSKIGKAVSDEIQTMADNAKDSFGSNSSNDSKKIKTVPEDYNEFPAFSRYPDNVSTKNERKYKRCSMDFHNATEDEIKDYVYLITNRGYIQKTNVRFEKENTYIIVDPDSNNGLNIVFHIKK